MSVTESSLFTQHTIRKLSKMFQISAGVYLADISAENDQSSGTFVERKLDGLIDSITDRQTVSQAATGKVISVETEPGNTIQPTDQDTPPTLSISDQCETNSLEDTGSSMHQLESLVKRHGFDTNTATTTDSEASDEGEDDNQPTEISEVDRALIKECLDAPEAERSLAKYRGMISSFPFVTISANTTVEEVRMRKPMLLLAIMVVTSWSNRGLQSSLEKRFRTELAHRTLLEPRKDMVLVQSMLVYIAWYHHFSDTSFLNISAVWQLCIGTLCDLGIDPVSKPQVYPRRLHLSVALNGRHEEHRTLLGCYYVSSMLANSLRKENMFRCTNYMIECSQVFESRQEVLSDQTLCLLVRARHIDDEIHNGYCSVEAHLSTVPGENPLAQLEIWETQLNNWKREASSRGHTRLMLLPLYATEMDLYNEALLRVLENNKHGNLDPTVSESSLRYIASSCLEAVRSFLDTLLAVPMEEFHHVTFAEWLRVPRVLMTLVMLCTSPKDRLPGWDTKAAQDRVRLDLYLESFCFRMQSITTFNPPSQPRPDFWMAMKLVMQPMRGWYKKKVDLINNAASPLSSKCPRHTKFQQATEMNVDVRIDTNNMFTPGITNMSSAPSQPASVLFPHTPMSAAGSGSVEMPLNLVPSSTEQTHDSFFPSMVPDFTGVCPGMDQFMNTDFWPDGMGPFDSIRFEF